MIQLHVTSICLNGEVQFVGLFFFTTFLVLPIILFPWRDTCFFSYFYRF